MRNYEGMRLPPTLDPHTRNELLKVDKFLQQLQAALKHSIEGGNNPRAVISGGSGPGTGGGTGTLPDHKHSGPGQGGQILGEHLGKITGYGKFVFNDSTAPQVQMGDVGADGDIILEFYGNAGGVEPARVIISFGYNVTALSGPQTTADMIGCAGARFYLFKDPAGLYDACYGQSFADNWVMPGPEDITYSIFSGIAPPGAAFLRAQWAGNGDYTNYGKVLIKKNPGAAIASTPALQLEETGAGTHSISLRAPAALITNRVLLTQDMTGTIPVVGDDTPAVASGALGKVDLAAQGADIASTNLTNSPLTGLYSIHYYYDCSVQDAAAGNLSATFTWTDEFGARTITAAAAALTSTANRVQGTVQVYVGSGNIAYSTTNSGAYGAAKYGIRVRLVYLG